MRNCSTQLFLDSVDVQKFKLKRSARLTYHITEVFMKILKKIENVGVHINIYSMNNWRYNTLNGSKINFIWLTQLHRQWNSSYIVIFPSLNFGLSVVEGQTPSYEFKFLYGRLMGMHGETEKSSNYLEVFHLSKFDLKRLDYT